MRWTGVLAVAITLACFESHARADGVTLKMGTLAAEGSRYMKDILALSREIEKRTDGKVKLRWYSDGKRGDELEMAAEVKAGTLHGGAFSDVGLVELAPQMRAFQYPGLFRDYAQVDVASSAVFEDVQKLFSDRQLVFAMWADLGFSRIFSSSKISTVDQVAGAPLTVDAAEVGTIYGLSLLGIDATSMERDAYITAIAADDVDVWAMPPLYAIANGVHVRARYVWGLPYRYVIGGLVFAQFAWKALTDDQQKIVAEVCREWEPKARERWRAETDDGLQALKKLGISLYRASESQTDAFFELADARRDAYAAHYGVEALMDALTGTR
jgi:TRAP-type C4-dicarboxylate transport system substrate-binding protein